MANETPAQDQPPPPIKDEELPADPSNPFLKDLTILPPLQSYGGSNEGGVDLPIIRAEEPVASLRAALSEVRGYAHLTNYRFVLEHNSNKGSCTTSPSEDRVGSDPSQVVSPFTGPDAVVSAASATKMLGRSDNSEEKEIVLDDFDDLKPLIDKGLEDGAAFRVVLERYDAATIRDHVGRLRNLLDGNAPSVTSLADDAAEAEDSDDDVTRNENDTEKEGAKESEAKAKQPEKLPMFPLEKPIVADGTNLRDFYYLSCGEEEKLWEDAASGELEETPSGTKSKKSKKKNRKKGKKNDNNNDSNNEEGSDKDGATPEPKSAQEICQLLNEFEQKTTIKCTVRYSGFHPPPSPRRVLGDLAYFEVTTPGYPEESVIHVTALPTGFYVNKTRQVDSDFTFDPSPADVPCFSHELLDCLLQKSKSLRTAWAEALNASKERASLTASLNDTPLESLHRVATRGDWGDSGPAALHPGHGVDSVVLRPSWLVPMPRSSNWNHNNLHEYNPTMTEEDLSNMHGLDLRGASVRDWNEELQSARELPRTDLNARVDRARLIHKVLTEYGEAAVVGVKAIVDGHVAPMNPNEPTRSHVYLHNNIFFSRAVDAGVETFKIAQGDRAAKKSSSRDAQCMGALHRLDIDGLHTLATVVVDYLGTRFVCQSIVPGILHGEKTHTLLYGAVEATAPLAWDKEMHELVEERIGRPLMIATRTVPKMPLSDERVEEIETLRIMPAMSLQETEIPAEDDDRKTNLVCGPVEAKGIRGSDQRMYLLDVARLTPRDANWVSQSKGGTGKWEAVMENGTNGKTKKFIPVSVDDDEWTTAILRPELITTWTHRKMAGYLRNKNATTDGQNADDKSKEEGTEESSLEKADGKSKEEAASQEKPQEDANDGEAKDANKDDTSPKLSKNTLTPEDEEYLKSLRLNLNVFIPHLRSLEGIDDDAVAQLKLDEDQNREVAAYLWDELLPKITRDTREISVQQLPVDGKSLTDILHQRGINCRYLGRLAALATKEEESDREAVKNVQAGNLERVPRRIMPTCWLELLECEMVARAAKHVLETYLSERGGAAACQPAQTIASFLSALMSEGEETAGETEMRIKREEKSDTNAPDEEDFNALAMFDTGGNGDAVPSPVRSRTQVWEDVQREVGRRFRYNLALYNSSSNRALHIPLLRRVCQRTGVRLVARNYDVGGKCLCSGGSSSGGRITSSYPVSPVDIIDIVPLVKHSGAQPGEGFVPYNIGASVGPPSLHIMLPDAKAAFDASNLHFNARALPKALDAAQEAISLYQRVVESPLHSNVARCLDLTSVILLEANEPQLAAANAARALGLVVQLGGFDCAEAAAAHSSLSHILTRSGVYAGGVKHLRSAMYLMELMAGPRYAELSNAYHRLATMYHEVGNGINALRFYQEASSRPSCDRLVEGMVARSTALVLAALGQFKPAVDCEKRAYNLFSLLLGDQHELTKSSTANLKKLTKLAVDQGTRQVDENKKRMEEAAADAMASQIEADEAEEEKKKKKGKKKKKKT